MHLSFLTHEMGAAAASASQGWCIHAAQVLRAEPGRTLDKRSAEPSPGTKRLTPPPPSPTAAPPHLEWGLDLAMLLICRLAFFQPQDSRGTWTGQLIRSR